MNTQFIKYSNNFSLVIRKKSCQKILDYIIRNFRYFSINFLFLIFQIFFSSFLKYFDNCKKYNNWKKIFKFIKKKKK